MLVSCSCDAGCSVALPVSNSSRSKSNQVLSLTGAELSFRYDTSRASTPREGTLSSVPSGSFTFIMSPSAAQAFVAASLAAFAALLAAPAALLTASDVTLAAVCTGFGVLIERMTSQARISAPAIAAGTSQRGGGWAATRPACTAVVARLAVVLAAPAALPNRPVGR